MGGLSTISQLKEELRIHLPDMVFLCETKNKNGFVQAVCKKLREITNWKIVGPRGLSGGMVLGYSDHIVVQQIISNDFCFEVEFTKIGLGESVWGIFVYASVDKALRRLQWQYLQTQKTKWCGSWFLGGDLNDIKNRFEKSGSNQRSERSFQ